MQFSDGLIQEKPNKKYDAVVVAVAHEAYKALDTDFFASISNGTPVLVDLKNLYSKEKMEDFILWSL